MEIVEVAEYLSIKKASFLGIQLSVWVQERFALLKVRLVLLIEAGTHLLW